MWPRLWNLVVEEGWKYFEVHDGNTVIVLGRQLNSAGFVNCFGILNSFLYSIYSGIKPECFELRASHLLGRQALYYLSHSTSLREALSSGINFCI
jgi:hypothetical protein